MVARADVHYFGAGPAPLPTAVLEEASKVLLNYKDKGIGLCEISHRSPDANEILANAKASLTDRKSTRLNSSHSEISRMPSSA